MGPHPNIAIPVGMAALLGPAMGKIFARAQTGKRRHVDGSGKAISSEKLT